MPSGRLTDAEIIAWVDAQPRHVTYSDLAGACLRAFGPERAWDAEMLRYYWQGKCLGTKRSPIDLDTEMLAFLRDHIDRWTIADMLKLCQARFTPERVPSRSALYRWVSRERVHRARQRMGADPR